MAGSDSVEKLRTSGFLKIIKYGCQCGDWLVGSFRVLFCFPTRLFIYPNRKKFIHGLSESLTCYRYGFKAGAKNTLVLFPSGIVLRYLSLIFKKHVSFVFFFGFSLVTFFPVIVFWKAHGLRR